MISLSGKRFSWKAISMEDIMMFMESFTAIRALATTITKSTSGSISLIRNLKKFTQLQNLTLSMRSSTLCRVSKIDSSLVTTKRLTNFSLNKERTYASNGPCFLSLAKLFILTCLLNSSSSLSLMRSSMCLAF